MQEPEPQPRRFVPGLSPQEVACLAGTHEPAEHFQFSGVQVAVCTHCKSLFLPEP